MGVIRSVSLILDLNTLRISKANNSNYFKIDSLIKYQEYITRQLIQKKKDIELPTDGITLNVKCNHSKTPIVNKLYTLKFGNHKRFFAVMHAKMHIRKSTVQK